MKRKLKKTSKDRVAVWRANQTDEQKKRARQLDRDRKAKKLANMTEEEKIIHREKDRLRKAAKKEPAPKNWRNLPRKFKETFDGCPYDEYLEKARLYQETKRLGKTEAEKEYERIYNLLAKRKSRAKRSIEQKNEENAKAKRGMHFMPFQPYKSRHKSKGQRKEYLLWQFWKKGEEYKDILRDRCPRHGAKFDMWDSKSLNPYKDDEVKEEQWNAMTLTEKKCEKNKQRRKLVKEQLQQPIEMPEFEQSDYEKLREKIIEERNAEFDKYMMEHSFDNSHL